MSQSPATPLWYQGSRGKLLTNVELGDVTIGKDKCFAERDLLVRDLSMSVAMCPDSECCIRATAPVLLHELA